MYAAGEVKLAYSDTEKRFRQIEVNRGKKKKKKVCEE